MEKETFKIVIDHEVEGPGSALAFLHSVAIQINKGFVHGEGWELKSSHEDEDGDVISGTIAPNAQNDTLSDENNKTPQQSGEGQNSSQAQDEVAKTDTPAVEEGDKPRKPWFMGGAS